MIYHYHNTAIHYTLEGQGSPLVLLHGFLESSTMWQAFLPQLTKTHQVLTIDLPGHGKSGNLAKGHSMESMAQLVFALTSHLDFNNITLVGHSMGGYIGLAMIEINPKQIHTFILLNSTTFIDNEDRKENRDRAIKFFKTQKEAIISMAIANLFTAEEHTMFKTEIEQLKKQAYTFDTEGLVACIIGMRDRKDRTEVLKNFKNKSLIIAGTKDPISPIEGSKHQSKTTKTPIIEIESGHMSWLTHAKKIAKLITD